MGRGLRGETLPHAALLFMVLQAKRPTLKSPIFFRHVSLPLMPTETSPAAAGDPSRQAAQAGGLPETLVWCPCVHTSPWTSWPVQQPGDPGEVPVVLLGILQSNCPYHPSHPNPKPGHPACPWAIRSEDQSRAGSFARYFPCRCLSSPQHAGRRAASTGGASDKVLQFCAALCSGAELHPQIPPPRDPP